MTLILSARDLREVLDVAASLHALRNGFRATASVAGQRYRTDLPFAGTATALLPGTLDDIPAFTVKANVKFPRAAPALRGVISLHSGADGELLAILDSSTITAWRTGLSAAIATDALARANGGTVGIIGAGAQADLVARGITHLRGGIDFAVHDIAEERAQAFAARHGGRVVLSPEAAAVSDAVVVATWSRDPVLRSAAGGQHITSLGSDEPGKRELAPDVLLDAVLIVDEVEQNRSMGVLSYVDREADATLGEVLAGRHPGRTTAEQSTVYAPVGLPWQDLALSWLAFQEAEQRGVGITVDLLA